MAEFTKNCFDQPTCNVNFLYAWFNQDCRNRINYYAAASKYSNYALDFKDWHFYMRDAKHTHTHTRACTYTHTHTHPHTHTLLARGKFEGKFNIHEREYFNTMICDRERHRHQAFYLQLNVCKTRDVNLDNIFEYIRNIER